MISTFLQAPIGAEVSIDLPIGRHHGRKYSSKEVIHFSKKHRAIRIDSVEEFTEGKPLHVNISNILPTQKQMLAWAEQIKGRGYSLVKHNCEHVKEMLAGNPPSSKQVQGAIGGAALGLGATRLIGFGPWGLVAGLVIGTIIGINTANK